jgi:sugar phosphate isomerase/epimerase
MRLALRENMSPGATLAEQLTWLERLGFDGVELCAASLDLPPRELRAIFAAFPVRAANVSGAFTLLHPDPKERAAARDLIRRRLDLAAELGAKAGVLVVPQFGREPTLPDLSPLKTAVELENELLVLQLRELAPAATAAGVPILLEPLNRYEAHVLNRLDQAVAVAEQVGPEITILADFFHMNIEETDIPAAVRAAGPRIGYVHVADSNRLQPGRGHLDFRPGFAALKETGYDGFLGIECRVAGPRDEALAESMALLREWWAAA